MDFPRRSHQTFPRMSLASMADASFPEPGPVVRRSGYAD